MRRTSPSPRPRNSSACSTRTDVSRRCSPAIATFSCRCANGWRSRARSDGDLFISLHADSIDGNGVSGSSVYTLSDQASDAEAAALAAKENKADAIAGANLGAYPGEVAGILIDLAQRETRNDSIKYAHTLVIQLDQSGRVLEHSVRSAGFAVLKAPDIPSVLLEMGYLSNPGEERELRDPRYRAKLMGAIKRAIEIYFTALDRMTRS